MAIRRASKGSLAAPPGACVHADSFAFFLQFHGPGQPIFTLKLRYPTQSVPRWLAKLELIRFRKAGIREDCGALAKGLVFTSPGLISLKSPGWSVFGVPGRSRRRTRMRATRLLLVTADDYGIGPETSRAIRELGEPGARLPALFCSSTRPMPKRHRSLAPKRQARRDGLASLFDHGCAHPAARTGSQPGQCEGRFLSLGGLLGRLARTDSPAELFAELIAQFDRYVALVGKPPLLVNGHKHIHVFPLIGSALRELLAGNQRRPTCVSCGNRGRCCGVFRVPVSSGSACPCWGNGRAAGSARWDCRATTFWRA